MITSPALIKDIFGLAKCIPKISIVIPVFNQERTILSNISSVLSSSSEYVEFIVIDDASYDNTLNVLIQGLPSLIKGCNTLTRLRLFSCKTSMFETWCDCFGLAVSEANYVIEIQADMTITEPGFDSKMYRAISAYPDLVMLSGRGTHKIKDVALSYAKGLGCERAWDDSLQKYLLRVTCEQLRAGAGKIMRFCRLKRVSKQNIVKNESLVFNPDQITPNIVQFKSSGEAGRLGVMIETNIFFHENMMWLGETVMRGPLIIDKMKYFEVGGFDSENFFLGYDDHDFCVRAWILKNYRVGYVPVGFLSPLDAGTMRKGKTWLQELSIFKNLWRINRHTKRPSLFNAASAFSKKPAPYEIRRF